MGVPTSVFWLLIILWQPPADASTTGIVKTLPSHVLKLYTNWTKSLTFKDLGCFSFRLHECILFPKSILAVFKTTRQDLLHYTLTLYFSSSFLEGFMFCHEPYHLAKDGTKLNEINNWLFIIFRKKYFFYLSLLFFWNMSLSRLKTQTCKKKKSMFLFSFSTPLLLKNCICHYRRFVHNQQTVWTDVLYAFL